MIWTGYQEVMDKLRQAEQKAGRAPGSVRLIAVSKTKPLEMIEELAAHGVTAFGENKVQELCAKKSACCYPDLEWHLIGHLQRNKVRQILQQDICMIHSVDSERLAKEIEKEAAKLGRAVSILIEVNIGREESKSGVMPEEAEALVEQIAASCPHLQIKGLMCVAPAKPEMEEVRPYFRRMRELQQQIADRQIPGVKMQELSMGMTGDFPVAVEEGATMIRVGSAIFGEREYPV